MKKRKFKTKLTDDVVGKTLLKFGYILIETESLRNGILYVHAKNKNGYMIKSSYQRIKNGQVPSVFHRNNPYTIQNIILWIKLNNKPFDLISEEYTLSKDELAWYCHKCKGLFYSCWNYIHSDCGCGVCRGFQVLYKTSLGYNYPKLATEWSNKNELSSFEVAPNYRKKVLWKCSKCEYEWEQTSNARVGQGVGCPACSGLAVTDKNRLSILQPNLIKEWNFLKNEFDPCDFTVKSNKKAWWICSTCSYEWNVKISDRSKGHGCPACSGRIATNKNRLSLLCPSISLEWNFEKNNLALKDCTWRSAKRVWWKCIECGHEWKALVYNRTKKNGTGCPMCSPKSNGENSILDFIVENNIEFVSQANFDGCKHKSKLRFDFYFPRYNLAIEYQGEQHYEPVGFWGGEEAFKLQQIKDQIKRDFCKENNISLLEIPYWEFDNIEQILSKYLKLTLDNIDV